MVNSLSKKVFIGFIMPIIFLLVAGGYSIYQFMELNKSAEILVDESYNTLSALNTMTNSLQEENDAILLLIIGDWTEGVLTLKSADSSFIEAFKKAERHTTIENKDIYLKKIVDSYSRLKNNWVFPIEKDSGQNNIDWYYESIHYELLEVTKHVNKFAEINEKYIYEEATNIKDNSKRAIIPGIVAIIASIIYLMLFNFLISKFMISPIKRITKAIKNYTFGSKSFDAKISSNDEIKELERSIRSMAEKVANKLEN